MDFRIKIADTMVVNPSAMGKEYHIPSKPKYKGRMITRGIKNIPCFNKVNIKAGRAFPIA